VTFAEFKPFRAKSFTKWYHRGKKAFPVLSPFTYNIFEEPVDQVLTELTRLIGDEKTATRVRNLQMQYPNGTVPELVVMDWLQANKYHYIYQGILYGGRASAGGLLPDFVVQANGASGMALQVQGDYWHGTRGVEKQFSDAADNLRLVGQNVGGIRINKVIGVWESDLYKRREQTMRMALAGVALR
jgi:hypothetical protein